MNKFNVVQIGLGPMGRLIMKLMLSRNNLNIVGAVDIDPDIVGISLSELFNNEFNNETKVVAEIGNLFSREKVDVVIIATSSSLEKVAPLIKTSVLAGCNVISICEELSFPFLHNPGLSEEINNIAKINGVSVVGTGINPGYLMDLLPIVITAPCQEVYSIEVTRMMNSARRREPFQRKIGTGLTKEKFHEKIKNKVITGHVGLTESIQMIVSALGLNYDKIEEFPPEEILLEKDFETTYGELVPKGNVCGLRSKALATFEGKDIILLNFIAYAGEHEEYDEIIIEGKPNIHQKIIGGVHGDLGTSAMATNLIPKVVSANPGLLTMKDLPVPCFTGYILKE